MAESLNPGASVESEKNNEQPQPGEMCPHCEEGFVKGDRVSRVPHCAGDSTGHLFWHYECLIRLTMGSVMHQDRVRSGLGCDSRCKDDPGLTPRQAAKAAEDYWERTRMKDEGEKV